MKTRIEIGQLHRTDLAPSLICDGLRTTAVRLLNAWSLAPLSWDDETGWSRELVSRVCVTGQVRVQPENFRPGDCFVACRLELGSRAG